MRVAVVEDQIRCLVVVMMVVVLVSVLSFELMLPILVITFNAKARRLDRGADDVFAFNTNAVEAELFSKIVQLVNGNEPRVDERRGEHIAGDARNAFKKYRFCH